MMDKKVLVLDLDGTLTNSNKEITPDTKDAIMKIQKKGHKVVLASGRPTPGVEPLAKELKLDKFGGYILSYNGGQIKDCKKDEVVYEQALPADVVPKLFNMADELNIGLATYDSDGIVANDNRNKYVELESRINNLPIQYRNNAAEYIDFPVNKCLGMVDPEIAPEKEQAYKDKFGDVLNITRSEPFFIEITPKGVDKAASLERFCEITGNTRENMIACGDGFNDISMIKYAGIGVAMANAQDEVKAVADFITTSNNDDGVARVIEKFVM